MPVLYALVQEVKVNEESGKQGCHDLAFVVAPDNTGEYRTYLDLLLANEVVRPMLENSGDSIRLWWFHRRWGCTRERTKLHELKFTLDCSKQVAKMVKQGIEANPVLQALDGVRCHVPERKDRRLEAAAEGTDWPDPAGWTWFIHSVSLLWLRLIGHHVANCMSESLEAGEEMYRTVERRVLRDWERHAGHALIHHLNAVFGYQPTIALTRSTFGPIPLDDGDAS